MKDFDWQNKILRLDFSIFCLSARYVFLCVRYFVVAILLN